MQRYRDGKAKGSQVQFSFMHEVYCLCNQRIYRLSGGNDMQAKDQDRTWTVFFCVYSSLDLL